MNRRFRLKYPAPMNSERWKCKWLNCANGMGLAGMGKCSSRGEWWNRDCPKFQTYEEIENEMAEAPGAEMKCSCGKTATWIYMPGDLVACDDCVPRGCSCQQEPKDGDWDNDDPDNWFDPIDDQGRKIPCIEWEIENHSVSCPYCHAPNTGRKTCDQCGRKLAMTGDPYP